jgi:hypothetical protein
VLEAYLAECYVCGFSLRLVDGLIAVDAAHIQWHSHGGPDEVPNSLALCALHHRLLDHGAITVREDLRVRVARSVAGGSARGLLESLRSWIVRRSGSRSTRSSTPTRGTCAGIIRRSSRGRCDGGLSRGVGTFGSPKERAARGPRRPSGVGGGGGRCSYAIRAAWRRRSGAPIATQVLALLDRPWCRGRARPPVCQLLPLTALGRTSGPP